jgi:NAD-dependent deacetylase sirtuin 2
MAEGGPSKPTEESVKDQADSHTGDWLASLFKRGLNLGTSSKRDDVEKLLEKPDLDSLVTFMKSDRCKNVITMAGAGISTSCGIPDFRSPGTGLYDNLAKYNLPHPQAVFELGYFKENPEPFFMLAKNLYPGSFKPSPCHYFIRLLQDKGLLLRHYTQNIDTLERVAGVKDDKLVEAHGTFYTGHCLTCRKEYTLDWMKEKIFADVIPHCITKNCDGIVKPDIVFFGENLPQKFFDCSNKDFPKCDLLIIMGTSLVVQPFASLTDRVADSTPRLYINLEKSSAQGDPMMALFGMSCGFRFDAADNYRDVFWQGTCDDGCYDLAEKLGWKDELQKLMSTEYARIDSEQKTEQNKSGANSKPGKL